MTKTERQQIVAYIDATVTYAIETLQGEFQTSTDNRTVFKEQVEATRQTLLTGKVVKAKKVKPTDKRTYAYGDQQWENPAQRG